MKTATPLVTVLLLSVAQLAQAGHSQPDYQQVEKLAFQATKIAEATFREISNIPDAYRTDRLLIRPSAQMAGEISFFLKRAAKRQQKNPPNAEEIRGNMLRGARAGERHADAAEDLARSLRRRADRADDAAVKEIAERIRRRADGIEELLERIQRELR
jgi:hypothetical protein